MRIAEIKLDARDHLKGAWGKGVLLTLLYFLISVVFATTVEITISGGYNNWINQDVTPISVDIFNFIYYLLLIPLTVGMAWFYISLVRAENPSISQVFTIYTAGNTVWKVLGTTIMISIFTFLWSLLLLIPGIIKALAYSQSLNLLRDNSDLGVFEAITESRRRMKGYKWKYFLLNLSFIGWAILGILTLGIGYLWLSPYVAASNAAFYKNIIADKETI
ncbi:DUF975 family protein [Bacillus sp. B1-b2]|uniref:DUF975 family protein n=1 Tax=Bacillus sp. B1-b2 TaxID=2653201 RepID=UPI0012629B79|nr:DUF975 family protein [Bacillus sp. B1-b2]KAB7671261.1 DUF975 family protein [Bacillus sp. B1-b2]